MADGAIDTRTARVSAEEALGDACQRPAREAGNADQQADHHRAGPLAGLFAGCGRTLPAYRPGPVARLRLHDQGQHGRGHLQRHRRARTGQSGRRRLQAGDGGQGRAVQALRRRRWYRSRDRHRGRRRIRQRRPLPRARLRRDQPRRHQGAGMLRHRAAPARADGHPGLP